jgi:hypothetical protein
VLDRVQRRELVVDEDHLASRVDHEADVEEHPREMLVARLGLRHDEHVPVPGQLPEEGGLLAGDVDRDLVGVGAVVEVEDLVGEALEGALGDRDQSHRQVEAGQPRRGRHHLGDVVEVAPDLRAPAHAAHGRDQADCGVGLDHGAPSGWPACRYAPSCAARPVVGRGSRRLLLWLAPGEQAPEGLRMTLPVPQPI